MKNDTDCPHILLVGNGPYLSRGCEAIARGTMAVLRKEYGGSFRATAASFGSSDRIREQALSETDPLVRHVALISGRWTPSWLLQGLNARLRKRVVFPAIGRASRSAVCALEIGGDNYSLDYGIPRAFLQLDRELMARGVPVILWGASVGPFDKAPQFATEMFEHLRNVRAILVRESASLGYLAANGVAENVYLVADPAFVMEPVEPSAQKLGAEIPVDPVGLSLSPLMARFAANGDVAAWHVRCVQLVETIVRSTGRRVLLIPHDARPSSDDFSFLRDLLPDIKPTYSTNVMLIPGTLSAAETKWVIAHCGVLVGARTHTTIAAMSSYVPTLSLAYSIKAVGINQDVYGTQDYCVRPEALTPGNVAERAAYMLDNRERIRYRMRREVPRIQQMAYKAGSILRQLLGERRD